MARLDEVFSAVTLLYISPLKSNLGGEYIKNTFNSDDLSFCDEILVKVSRSFAAVIRQLPEVMLVDVLVFYLILRALDTIEDDTTAFDSHATKVKVLKEFYKALDDPNWTMTGVGEGDERKLLEEFPKCQRIFQQLQPEARDVIKDITKRMADGMADFVAKDMGQGTEDMQQYNLYCHYVAGLVGEGLSRLFSASGLEQKSFGEEKHLSNQMGLFLQKTNIIRDYLEDYVDKRAWWPQTVWKKYSASGDLGYFANQADDDARKKALMCLNELVTDALELVPDCLTYLSKLECAEIFRFCAIPQVMAIATLDKCFANPDVFTGVVKIRKGLSCQLILRTNTIAEVHSIFSRFARSVRSKALAEQQRGANDPSFDRTIASCDKIASLTKDAANQQTKRQLIKLTSTATLLGAALLAKSSVGLFGRNKNMVSTGLALAGGILYWYGPWSIKSNLLNAHVLKAKKQLG